MSEFDNLMRSGFAESRAMMGVNVTFGAVTVVAISTPIQEIKDAQVAGYLPGLDVIIDLLRTDFVSLGVGNRDEVTINSKTARIVAIDDDPAEPCVRLTCTHGR